MESESGALQERYAFVSFAVGMICDQTYMCPKEHIYCFGQAQRLISELERQRGEDAASAKVAAAEPGDCALMEPAARMCGLSGLPQSAAQAFAELKLDCVGFMEHKPQPGGFEFMAFHVWPREDLLESWDMEFEGKPGMESAGFLDLERAVMEGFEKKWGLRLVARMDDEDSRVAWGEHWLAKPLWDENAASTEAFLAALEEKSRLEAQTPEGTKARRNSF